MVLRTFFRVLKNNAAEVGTANFTGSLCFRGWTQSKNAIDLVKNDPVGLLLMGSRQKAKASGGQDSRFVWALTGGDRPIDEMSKGGYSKASIGVLSAESPVKATAVSSSAARGRSAAFSVENTSVRVVRRLVELITLDFTLKFPGKPRANLLMLADESAEEANAAALEKVNVVQRKLQSIGDYTPFASILKRYSCEVFCWLKGTFVLVRIALKLLRVHYQDLGFSSEAEMIDALGAQEYVADFFPRLALLNNRQRDIYGMVPMTFTDYASPLNVVAIQKEDVNSASSVLDVFIEQQIMVKRGMTTEELLQLTSNQVVDGVSGEARTSFFESVVLPSSLRETPPRILSHLLKAVLSGTSGPKLLRVTHRDNRNWPGKADFDPKELSKGPGTIRFLAVYDFFARDAKEFANGYMVTAASGAAGVDQLEELLTLGGALVFLWPKQ